MGKHAIIVLKNGSGEYLQYFEKKWESFLFINCKMKSKSDYLSINNKINEMFDVNSNDYKINYIGTKIHTKYSVKDKIDKEYTHYFYVIEFNSDCDFFNCKMFEKNDILFRWFSYSELEYDDRIQEVNGDIVSFIKDFCI